MAKKSSKRFNIQKLETLATGLKKLDDGKYRIQVGIFGDKDLRPKDQKTSGPTNAEIGYLHEIGSVERHIPRRSFLWDTFALHGAELENLLAPIASIFLDKTRVDEYLKKSGEAALSLVVTAFQTGGFGAWPPNAYETVLRKLRRGFKSLKRRKGILAQAYAGQAAADQVLVETGQLWQAQAYRVVKGA